MSRSPFTKNGLKKATFILEFANLPKVHNASTGKLVLVDDFKVHLDNKACQDTQHVQELMDSYNVVQHVTSVAIALDWILSRSDDNIVHPVQVSTPISDQHNGSAAINMKKPALPKHYNFLPV